MTRRTFAVFGFALLATGGVCAADVPPTHSALLTDITITENDSRLVRAAKLVAAERARMAVHSTHVIDNDSLRRVGASHFSIATTEPTALPTSRAPTTLGPVSPAVSPYRQVAPPNLLPVIQTQAPTTTPPFQLPPPPPTSSPVPYRPQP
jgi:hypothetical protein